MKHFILPVCTAIAVAAAVGSCANEAQSTLEPQKINMSKFTEKNGFQSEDNGVVTSVVFYTPEIVRVTKTPANSTKIGRRPAQLIKGTRAMVIRRLLRLSIVRVAIMAGTLQPKPITMGMKLLPCRPRWCISLSTMKAVRAI